MPMGLLWFVFSGVSFQDGSLMFILQMTGVLGLSLEEAKDLCAGASEILMASKEHWHSHM